MPGTASLDIAFRQSLSVALLDGELLFVVVRFVHAEEVVPVSNRKGDRGLAVKDCCRLLSN